MQPERTMAKQNKSNQTRQAKRTVQNQHNNGRNERTMPKRVDSKTGTSQTAKMNEGRKPAANGTGKPNLGGGQDSEVTGRLNGTELFTGLTGRLNGTEFTTGRRNGTERTKGQLRGTATELTG